MGIVHSGESAGGPGPEPQRLGARYELGPVLGYGGMAIVRRGTDLRLGRTVAVKILRGELTEAPAFQARFRREARAAASLGHPAIVGVYDAGEEVVDGTAVLYIVMEYVDGHTLRQLLRTGPQPCRRAAEITADVLAALAHSHRSGIVHRDIKPANVMLTRSGAVKVMDFGVARAVADMSASLTQTSAVIGTAHYLSPEQARGDAVDARSDVYSTGCLLYELLTGRPPFEGDSAIAVAYQHVREDPHPPSAYMPGVPAEIDAIVLGALAKKPAERYQSADDMRRALLAFLAGEDSTALVPSFENTADLAPVADPVAGTVAGPVTGTAAAARRRRYLRPVLAAAAVVIAAGLAGFAWSGMGGDLSSGGGGPQQGQVGGRDAGQRATAPTPAQSQSLEPAGSSDDVPGDDRVAELPREKPVNDLERDRDPRRAVRDTSQDTPDVRTPATFAPQPADTPAPTPAPEDTATQTPPADSPPPESPQPEPSVSEEPQPTPPPDAEQQGTSGADGAAVPAG